MKVLFVASSNSRQFDVPPHVQAQAESLRKAGAAVDMFRVKLNKFRGVGVSIRRLRAYLKDHPADVLHAHYVYNGIIARLGGRRTPLVVSFMGSDLKGIVNERGRDCWMGRVNRLASWLLCLGSRTVIVKSADMLPRIPRVARRRAHVVPNGVDFERFQPESRESARRRLGLTDEERRVLFLGNPQDRNKNIQLAEEAVRRLADPGVRLWAPYPIRPEEVPVHLNAADVVLLTSRTEGSPNVVKEAMACNRPLVTVDVGDARDIVGATDGVYVTSYDPAEIGEALRKALAFGEATRGRDDIARLDSREVARRLLDIYAKAR